MDLADADDNGSPSFVAETPELLAAAHPVDLARARLDHVLRHCGRLEDEVQLYLDRKPFRAIHEHYPLEGLHVMRAQIIEPPPKRLGFMVADALRGIRSALDNLFWAFANQHKTPPAALDAGFPIYNDYWGDRRNCWAIGGLNSIAAVSYDVGEAIKEVQPCVRSKADPDGDPLWMLHQLCSDDRRTPIGMTGAARGRIVGADFHRVRGWVSGPLFNDGPFQQGGFLSVYEAEPGSDADVEIDLPFDWTVSLSAQGPARGAPLVDLVRDLHDHVETDVLPRFEKL